MTLCKVGIGSNLGDAGRNVAAATEMLAARGRLVAVSDHVGSRAWGVSDQPDFVNAVAIIDTDLPPLTLLHEMQAIELRLGRRPTYKWGPRLIDLDILEYGNEIISSPALTVPHPHMYERAFVLAPLAQLDDRYRAALNCLPEAVRNQIKRLEPAR